MAVLPGQGEGADTREDSGRFAAVASKASWAKADGAVRVIVTAILSELLGWDQFLTSPSTAYAVSTPTT